MDRYSSDRRNNHPLHLIEGVGLIIGRATSFCVYSLNARMGTNVVFFVGHLSKRKELSVTVTEPLFRLQRLATSFSFPFLRSIQVYAYQAVSLSLYIQSLANLERSLGTCLLSSFSSGSRLTSPHFISHIPSLFFFYSFQRYPVGSHFPRQVSCVFFFYFRGVLRSPRGNTRRNGKLSEFFTTEIVNYGEGVTVAGFELRSLKTHALARVYISRRFASTGGFMHTRHFCDFRFLFFVSRALAFLHSIALPPAKNPSREDEQRKLTKCRNTQLSFFFLSFRACSFTSVGAQVCCREDPLLKCKLGGAPSI